MTSLAPSEDLMPAFIAALENLPVSATVADMRQEGAPLVFVNRQFEETTGYSAVEVLGRNCRFLQGAATDQRSVEMIRQALEQGIPCNLDILNYRKSGQPFWNNLRLSPVRDESGGVSHFIGIQQDVSSILDASRMNAERQRLEALEVVFRGFRHEVNNLIHPLINFARFSKETLEEQGSNTRFIDGVLQAARSIQALTQERLFLGLADPANGGFCDLAERITAEAKLFQLESHTKGPQLDVDVDVETAVVPLSPVQANVILVNLLVNARKATPESGRISVTLKAVAPHKVQLTVSDTGSGIEKEHLGKIFEPYFTTRPGAGGIGLGLTNVYNIVTSCGGTIRAESEFGRGTCFTVDLPLTTRPGDGSENQSNELKRAASSSLQTA